MSVRLLLTDEAWEQIATLLARLKHPAGKPPALRDRMFIAAVLYVARTGIPWRDMPAAFGHWDAVDNRFRRGERRGVWRQLWQQLQHDEFRLAKDLFIASTIVRAHQQAAGA